MQRYKNCTFRKEARDFEQRNMRIVGKALRGKKLLEPFLRFGICVAGRRLSSISDIFYTVFVPLTERRRNGDRYEK